MQNSIISSAPDNFGWRIDPLVSLAKTAEGFVVFISSCCYNFGEL